MTADDHTLFAVRLCHTQCACGSSIGPFTDQGPLPEVKAFVDLREQGARSTKVLEIDKRAAPPIPPVGLANASVRMRVIRDVMS
jgi:hypothetical protein